MHTDAENVASGFKGRYIFEVAKSHFGMFQHHNQLWLNTHCVTNKYDFILYTNSKVIVVVISLARIQE